MAQFDVTSFCDVCIRTLAEFEKTEKIKYDQNALLFKTPRQINLEFKIVLDAIRLECGFDLALLYLTERMDGSVETHSGEDLWDTNVIFNENFYLEELREHYRNKDSTFPFEREFVEEYNKCTRRFAFLKQGFKQTRDARFVALPTLVSAISQLEEEYTQARDDLRFLVQSRCNHEIQERVQQNVAHLRTLLVRLTSINRRGA